jgi:hypothetical protein
MDAIAIRDSNLPGSTRGWRPAGRPARDVVESGEITSVFAWASPRAAGLPGTRADR